MHSSFVVVLAMLPVVAPFVEYEQLEQPADLLPDQVVVQIAALAAGMEQQAYVAVVDRVAEAMVVQVRLDLVHVSQALPLHQVE